MKPEDKKFLLICSDNKLKFYSEFITELTNKNYRYGRMSIILEGSGDCCIDEVDVSRNTISTIQRYFSTTSEYNKCKFTKMINNNIDNVDIVYDLILTATG